MAYASRLAEAIKYLYPTYSPRIDWLVENRNGNVVIAKWNIPADQPTEQEVIDAIASVDATASTEASRVTGLKTASNIKDFLLTANKADVDAFYSSLRLPASNLSQANVILSSLADRMKKHEYALVLMARAAEIINALKYN